MIWIDYVIIGIIIISILVSLICGFIREALSLVTWFFAFFIASHYYSYLTIYLTHVEKQMVRNCIAITLLFVMILVVGAIVNYLISSLIAHTGLSITDRVLGICFGLLRGVIIISIILFYLETFTGFSHTQDWQRSQLRPQFSSIKKCFFDYLKSKSSFLLMQ
ncbi:CvpA family protein [Candidatus Hoaglandella endobia]|nr:CvpA family protein [Candidatus Hoaglandella endobia]